MHDCIKGGDLETTCVVLSSYIVGYFKINNKCTHINFVAGAYANFNDVYMYMYMYMNRYYTGGVASNKFLMFTCM